MLAGSRKNIYLSKARWFLCTLISIFIKNFKYGKYIKISYCTYLLCFLTRIVLAPLPDYNMRSTKLLFTTSNKIQVNNMKMHIIKVNQDGNNILLTYGVYGLFPSLSRDKNRLCAFDLDGLRESMNAYFIPVENDKISREISRWQLLIFYCQN